MSGARWMLSDCETIAFDRKLLQLCVARLSRKARADLIAQFRTSREAFARTDHPGHAFWYPVKVQEEARAAEVLGFDVPPYAAALAAQEAQTAD